MLASPEKRRFEAISGHHASPIALKRQRAAIPSSLSASLPLKAHSVDAEPLASALYTIDQNDPSNSDLEKLTGSGVCTTSMADNLQQKLLDKETHTNRLTIQDQMASGKGTETAYARHLKRYFEFWDADQEERTRRDPYWKKIPAEPITVRNVALFLQYETSRTKVRLAQVDLLMFRLFACGMHSRTEQRIPKCAQCPDFVIFDFANDETLHIQAAQLPDSLAE